MPAHRGRYPFKVYVQLVFYVALLAVLNTLFGNLLQALVGHYDLVYVLTITAGIVAYALVFAFLFWRFDGSGSIGGLLGAKNAEES
jgi:hypothetical protein